MKKQRTKSDFTTNARANEPLAVFFPDKNTSDKKTIAEKINSIPNPDVKISEVDRIIEEPILCKIGCLLAFNKKKETKCLIILSLHFIEFYKLSEKTHKYEQFHATRLYPIHLFDISSVRIDKKPDVNNKQVYKILLYAKTRSRLSNRNQIINCKILATEGLKFCQYLYRNYMLSTVVYDETKKWEFVSYDRKEFPTFVKSCLSPSQQYQLTYSCFCARIAFEEPERIEELKYDHRIARFYHEHLLFRNGIFDFAMLKNYKKDLEPAIQAMMFVPYVMAFLGYDMHVENFSQSIKQILQNSRYLKALHVSNCYIDEVGMDAIGEGLLEHNNKTNDNSKVIQYWNFENNPIRNATKFFDALGCYRSDYKKKFPIFYLSFSNCQIEDMTHFFDTLKNNPDLLSLKYLYFNGNNVNDVDLTTFQTYLQNKHNQKNEESRQLLKLGIAGDGPVLKETFQMLFRLKFEIEELSLAGTKIERQNQDSQYYQPSEGAAAIIYYLENTKWLKTLDLSDTNIEKEDLVLILQAYNKSDKVKKYHVKLNNICPSNANDDEELSLQLRKSRMLIAAATAFNYTDMTKWNALEFADNDLSAFELDFLLSVIRNMTNLTSINLSHNFVTSDPSIEEVLPYILQNPATKEKRYLKKIYLAGCHNHRIGQAMYPFLDALLDNQSSLEDKTRALTVLDLSGQKMGDTGYHKVTLLVDHCDHLKKLMIDDNYPENLRVFYKLIDTVMGRSGMIFFPFPSFDMMRLVNEKNQYAQKLDEKEKHQLLWLLLRLRNKCDEFINANRLRVGKNPQLPFKTVPELASMSYDIHETMVRLLQDTEDLQPELHGGVSIDIGVPLPHRPDIPYNPTKEFEKYRKKLKTEFNLGGERAVLNSVPKILETKYYSPNIRQACDEKKRGTEFDKTELEELMNKMKCPDTNYDDDGMGPPPNTQYAQAPEPDSDLDDSEPDNYGYEEEEEEEEDAPESSD